MLRYFEKNQFKRTGAAVVLLLAAVVLSQCGNRAFSDMRPLHVGSHIAVYQMDFDDYPPIEQLDAMPTPQPFPAITGQQLYAILGNLAFERRTLWGSSQRRVFLPQELEWVVFRLMEQIAKLEEGDNKLVLVTRYDPDRSVLSRMERTTALIWSDESGLNIAFGVIKEELPVGTYTQQVDWLNVSPISLQRAHRDISILEQEGYEFGQLSVSSSRHDTWVVVPHENIAAIEWREVVTEREAGQWEKDQLMRDQEQKRSELRGERIEQRPGSPVKQPAASGSPAERLKSIKELFDADLISEEEYEKLRQQILSEI